MFCALQEVLLVFQESTYSDVALSASPQVNAGDRGEEVKI